MKINKRIVIPVACACLGLGSILIFQRQSKNNLGDKALLSLIKNDQEAFKNYIEKGGDLHLLLPKIDGQALTVSEAMAYFERTSFVSYLQREKKSFIKQDMSKDYDILSIAIEKNNPELLEMLLNEKAKFDRGYGKDDWTLLHMASASCSYKLVSLLSKKIEWQKKAKDGSTPLTLAADHDCLPMLSYWKEQGADFKKKDGRGLSALDILKKKKDAALTAFAESFEPRRPAAIAMHTAVSEPDFYKKRKVPKERLTKDSDLVEPNVRPEEAYETAEYSEFSD